MYIIPFFLYFIPLFLGNCKEIRQKLVASNGFYNLGLVLYGQNKYSDAIPFLEKCVTMRIEGGLHKDDPDHILEVKDIITKCKSKCYTI